jgi:hypothetical protein
LCRFFNLVDSLFEATATTSAKGGELKLATNSQGTGTAHLIQLIRKAPSYSLCTPIYEDLAGKYQDSENDKVVQQEHSLTVSKIDKETFDRITEESRRLKFENESAHKSCEATKAELVRYRAYL